MYKGFAENAMGVPAALAASLILRVCPSLNVLSRSNSDRG